MKQKTKVNIFTIAGHRWQKGKSDGKLKYLKKSSENFDLDINYIYLDKWSGWYDKFDSVKKYVNKMAPQDIFIWVDGFDVFCNSKVTEIINKFKSFSCDILYSGESQCWPARTKEDMDRASPENAVNKYICAGCWMSTAEAFKKILNWKPEAEVKKICKLQGGDQLYHHLFFLDNYKNKDIKIKIDLESKVFKSMNGELFSDMSFKDGRFSFKSKHKTPCFIHFNGKSHWKKGEKGFLSIMQDKLEQSANLPNKTFDLSEFDPNGDRIFSHN